MRLLAEKLLSFSVSLLQSSQYVVPAPAQVPEKEMVLLRMHPATIINAHLNPCGMRLKPEGLSHGLKTCRRTVLYLRFAQDRFSGSIESAKKERVPLVPSLFWCECSYRTFRESASYQRFFGIGHIQLPSTSLGMRLKVEGLSHGLKSVHRTLFAPVCGLVSPFRVPSRA